MAGTGSSTGVIAGKEYLDSKGSDGSYLQGTLVSESSITSESATSGIGYATGAGGAVTQITNRATGVTVNAICGQITTDNTSLAAEASAKFTVTNSAVAEADVIVISFRDAVGLNTDVVVTDTAAGTFELTVINNNVAAGTAETGVIIINFAIIKAVAA